MRLTLYSVVIVLSIVILQSTAMAQYPTFTYSHIIDISPEGTTPTGIDFYDGNLYVASFDNRNLFEVTNPESPTGWAKTEILDASGLAPWASGRGLTGVSVDPGNGDVFICGDSGSGAAIFKYNISSATVTASLIDASSTHRVSGCDVWGSTPDLVVGGITTGGVYDVQNNLSGFDSGITSSTLYIRDVVMVGNDFYGAYTKGDTTNAILKWTGGTPGDLSGYSSSAWVTLSSGTWNAANGITYWNDTDDSMEYIIWANKVDQTVEIYDLADASLDFTLAASDTGGLMTQPFDAVVGVTGGVPYLYVTSDTGYVVVFTITTSTNVNDWDQY